MVRMGQYDIFLNLRNKVKRFVQHATDGDIDSLVNDAINFVYQEGATRHDWPQMLVVREGFSQLTHRDDFTDIDGNPVATTNDTAGGWEMNGMFALPSEVDELFSLFQGAPSGTFVAPPRIQLLEADEFYLRVSHDPDQAGIPQVFTKLGVTPLRIPLVQNENLRVKSSSASDSNDVTIQGFLGNNNWISQNQAKVTLNGTADVQFSGSWRRGWSLSRISVEGSHAGTIQIFGATTNLLYFSLRSQSAAGVLDDSYSSDIKPLVRVWPTLNSSQPITLIYKKYLRPLINDEDEIEIPIANYIEEAAIARIYEYKRLNDLAQIHTQRSEDMIQRQVINQETTEVHLSKPPARASVLGLRSYISYGS